MAISFLKVKKFLFRHSWVTGPHSSSTWFMLGIRKSVKRILKNGSKSNLLEAGYSGLFVKMRAQI